LSNILIPLINSDFEVFADFFIQNSQLHSSVEPSFFKIDLEIELIQEHFEQIISDTDFIAFKCIENEEIVGLIYGYHFKSKSTFIMNSRNYVQIQNIFVKSEFRNRGIAKQLISHFESHCTSLGISDIELIVWKFNETAKNLYSKLGYESKLERMSKTI
jgi:diamine N-acetyltransferase